MFQRGASLSDCLVTHFLQTYRPIGWFGLEETFKDYLVTGPLPSKTTGFELLIPLLYRFFTFMGFEAGVYPESHQ